MPGSSHDRDAINMRASSAEVLDLVRPIMPHTKRHIIQNLWPSIEEQRIKHYKLDWEPYFDYYQDQCAAALHEEGTHMVLRTHQQIIDLSKELQKGRSSTSIRADVKDLFIGPTRRPDEDEIVDNSIDLIARLYLMVNVSTCKSTVTQGTRLFWNARNMHHLLQDTFQRSHGSSETVVRLEKNFIALNLERIAGITIHWTDNLADHLRIVEDDRVVAIFHHATFLSRQQHNAVWPSGFINETIRTLALLFPKQNQEGLKWLRTAHASSKIDSYLMYCDQLRLEDRQIQKFEFWKHRLIILKQAFDESRPIKIKQWWYDRRDGYLWYTFWFASCAVILAFIFGTTQVILAAFQVHKAFHPTFQEAVT